MIEREWVTKIGLPAIALIVCRENGRKSHRCGYVGVPRPGLATNNQWGTIRALDGGFSVHGGVTYARYGHPASGEETPFMAWVGFDCHHGEDREIEPDPDDRWYSPRGAVRSLEYVVENCEELAAQMLPWILPMGG